MRYVHLLSDESINKLISPLLKRHHNKCGKRMVDLAEWYYNLKYFGSYNSSVVIWMTWQSIAACAQLFFFLISSTIEMECSSVWNFIHKNLNSTLLESIKNVYQY